MTTVTLIIKLEYLHAYCITLKDPQYQQWPLL